MTALYENEDAKKWLQALTSKRLDSDNSQSEKLSKAVKDVIAMVRAQGDAGLKEIAARFKDPKPRCLQMDSDEAKVAIARLTPEIKSTLQFAAERITKFAEGVMSAIKPVDIQFDQYSAGIDFKPIQRAACYVPGGRYPLPSTALMTALTAKVAGVKEIVIFTPALKDEIIFAGSLAGVSTFYEIGGAQAVAAAALGTETIKAVDIVVGPGNAYVTEAKRQLQGIVGIDMLAGPSEIAVIADGGANAEWVCLDLLSQAEHDPDARAYLFTDDKALAETVLKRLPELKLSLQLPDFVSESLSLSVILLLDSIDECVAAANAVAPEHLLLEVKEPQLLKAKLTNYGALFMGYSATVAYGDYCAGPNHTLPTNRAARFSGGLNPLTFLRANSWLEVPSPSTVLATRTAEFAHIEGLIAHEAAASARVGK
jgi:histidinol dehydrogenase